MAQVEDGSRQRIDPAQVAKIAGMVDQGFSALQAVERAGVRIVFGTDLLGATQQRQSEEFALSARGAAVIRVRARPPAALRAAAAARRTGREEQ